MWVNSEKYIFTPSVVTTGRELFAQFNVVRQTIKSCKSVIDDLLLMDSVIAELVEDLTDLDFKWTLYERMYVSELQVIENDSRRFIFEAVDLDVQLTAAEKSDSLTIQENLLRKICQINSIANPTGKGRDDF